MAKTIQPRVLKGFRDFLPDKEIARKNLIRSLEDHFISYGYVPIDTPSLEYTEILLSKGGGETDKQTYRFTDHGGRDVALRFDLTVPFARFVAANRNNLPMPFKRFHIGKVWRGENTQRGRYREFIQCDFDIVGTDSAASDLEIMLMMHYGLKAIGAGESTIRFNHRGIFNLLLDKIGISGKTADVLRIVDKLQKIGIEEVGRQLAELTGNSGKDILLDFITPGKDNRSTLNKMLELSGAGGSSEAIRLETVLSVTEEIGIAGNFQLDPSITRGLDYYTGIVFETFLNDLPSLGSVCSGGRYDNLTGLFMKEPLSGVGASIGLDRLISGLEELGQINSRKSLTEIIIFMLDEKMLPQYQKYADFLRTKGFSVEVYPDQKKLGTQFKYAENKDIPLALIAGEEEKQKGTVNLKNLSTRENFENITLEEAGKKAFEILGK